MSCTSPPCWKNRPGACSRIRSRKSLAENFAGEWLYLRNLKDLQPDVYLFPDSDDNLFQSMKKETELFFRCFHARGPQHP